MNRQAFAISNLNKLQQDLSDFFCNPRPKDGMGLFEIACLGKPELALQGELLFHLRSKHWVCTQEAGYSYHSGFNKFILSGEILEGMVEAFIGIRI